MASLTYTLQESMELAREAEWRKAGVPEPDILMSRLTGMDAGDLQVLRAHSAQGYLFVIRCPKLTARAHHGRVQPKTARESKNNLKSGDSGIAVTSRRTLMLSDYDPMSFWRRDGARWVKIFASAAHGADRGPLPLEAQRLLVALNQQLESPFQHGAQDDFHSTANPPLKAGDRFCAILSGRAESLPSLSACEAFYQREGLAWPYRGGVHFSVLGLPVPT